jgi:hypothetical protein
MHVIPYRLVFIPMLFKSRNRLQIKTKFKMPMSFLDKNFMLFPMVHLFFAVLYYYVQENG